MRVIDIGCGPGDVTMLAAAHVEPTGRNRWASIVTKGFGHHVIADHGANNSLVPRRGHGSCLTFTPSTNA
jgi:hypothetical protein